MPTLKSKRSLRKTRKAGGGKKNEKLAADAKELKVDKYLYSNLKKLGEVADGAAELFTGYHDDYFKTFGLVKARKTVLKAFNLLEIAEREIMNNKFYNRDYVSSNKNN